MVFYYTYPVLLDGRTVISQCDLRGRGSEVRQAQDGQVLVVQAVIMHNDLFNFFHNWQNPWLALICPVGCEKQFKETNIIQKSGGKSEAFMYCVII